MTGLALSEGDAGGSTAQGVLDCLLGRFVV